MTLSPWKQEATVNSLKAAHTLKFFDGSSGSDPQLSGLLDFIKDFILGGAPFVYITELNAGLLLAAPH